MDDLERRRRRLRRAHRLIRAELALAVAVPFLAGFLFVAAPAFSGGTSTGMYAFVDTLLSIAAVVGVLVGFVWMIRLSRPDPEAGERTWRFRDF